MSEQNVELVRGAYDSFAQGDVPAVLESFDPEIEWNEPGPGNAPSGTFNGPEAIASGVFARIPQQFEEYNVTPSELSDQGDSVIARGRFTGRNRSGDELDVGFEHSFEIRDGKIARFQGRVDDPGAYDAAWS
jgi:ketosteroid isomerase-like protein